MPNITFITFRHYADAITRDNIISADTCNAIFAHKEPHAADITLIIIT